MSKFKEMIEKLKKKKSEEKKEEKSNPEIESPSSLENYGQWGAIIIFLTIFLLGALNSLYNLDQADDFKNSINESLTENFQMASDSFVHILSFSYDQGGEKPRFWIVVFLIALFTWTFSGLFDKYLRFRKIKKDKKKIDKTATALEVGATLAEAAI